MIEPSAAIARSRRAVSRELADGGGAVLLNLDNGAYYALNPVGLLIWSILESDMTYAGLLDRIQTEVEGAPPTLADETAQFLRELEKRDLITIKR